MAGVFFYNGLDILFQIVYICTILKLGRVKMMMLTGNQIHKARLLALQAGMNLEAKGIRMNRGKTAMSIVKQEFGFKGNRSKIQTQLQTVIDSMSNNP